MANLSFSCGGDRVAFTANDIDVYGGLCILNSSAGTVSCTIDDDDGHCVHSYLHFY
jgi:hypothetical protein